MSLLVRIPMSPTSKPPVGLNNPKKSLSLPFSRGERAAESEQSTHIVLSDTAIWYHYWRVVLHGPRMCSHCCSTPSLDQVPASLIDQLSYLLVENDYPKYPLKNVIDMHSIMYEAYISIACVWAYRLVMNSEQADSSSDSLKTNSKLNKNNAIRELYKTHANTIAQIHMPNKNVWKAYFSL